MLSLGPLVGDPDPVRAAALFEKACNLGYAASCTNLAAAYESGNGVAADLARAVSLYERGCALGNFRGCRTLANTTTIATERRLKSLHEACELGSAAGCISLGAGYQSGNGVPRDPKRASSLYERACGLGLGAGCRELAMNHDEGLGVTQSIDKANALYDGGCTLRDGHACSALGASHALAGAWRRTGSERTGSTRRVAIWPMGRDVPCSRSVVVGSRSRRAADPRL
jgi:hypothetical protein